MPPPEAFSQPAVRASPTLRHASWGWTSWAAQQLLDMSEFAHLLVRFCQQDDPDPNSGNPKKVKKKARIGSRFRLLAGLFAIDLCLPLNVPCTMNPVRYILSADR